MNSALILVLSAVALAAHGIKGGIELQGIISLAVAGFLGTLGGATLAEKKLPPRVLQRVFRHHCAVAAIKAVYGATMQ